MRDGEEQMSYCSKCGATLPEGAKFCQQCGQVNGGRQTQPAPVAAAPVPYALKTEHSPEAVNKGLCLTAAILIAVFGLYSLLFINFAPQPGPANMLIMRLPAFIHGRALGLMIDLALPVGLILLGLAKRKILLGIGAAALALLALTPSLLQVLLPNVYVALFLHLGDTGIVFFQMRTLVISAGSLWLALAGLIMLLKPKRQLMVGILAIAISVLVFMAKVSGVIASWLHFPLSPLMMSGLLGVGAPLMMAIGCLLIAAAAIYSAVKA